MKQPHQLLLVFTASILLSSCTKPTASPTPTSQVSPSQINTCTPGDVSLPNYGDPGHRLANCFVQYPGEPSRQDKSYYIVEDICGQFTPDFFSNMLTSPIVKTEGPHAASLYNCRYYLNDKENILLNLEYLPIANQKIGQEAMGRTTAVDSSIPMTNMVVYQENKVINTIYLVLDDNKFLSLTPSSAGTLTSDQFLRLAANIATAIRDYK